MKKMLNLVNRSQPKRKPTHLNDFVEENSSRIINFIGYIILAFTILDYIEVLIPLKFLNPIWEFQVFGRFIELSWAPLLGLVLIFYRRQEDLVKATELKFLSLISRLTLAMAIAYFLMFPLLISNCIRISVNNSAIANQQLMVYSERSQQIEAKINQATETEVEQLIANFPEPKIIKNISNQQFKEKLLTENTSKQKAASQQVKQELRQQQIELYKSTIKWAIGAILTGFSALFIWKSTKWARVLRTELE